MLLSKSERFCHFSGLTAGLKGTISTVLFVCLKEKVSPLISICSHIVRGLKVRNITIFVRGLG